MTALSEGGLAQTDLHTIREHAAASDRSGLLVPALQALIHQRGWLSMLAPRACGGAEMPLPQAVLLEEALAAADGSVGWTVTLCAGAGWFAGFLEPDFAREIVSTPAMCLGGSGAPTGFADVDGDGYRLSGRWEIATGAPLATHFTMNAVVRIDGKPCMTPSGAPRVRAFVVPAAQVSMHKSWHSIGMRATASHGFNIASMWVSQRHGFDIDPACATAPGPLYRFPFASLAYVTLAANFSGMAGHFLALAEESLGRRRRGGAGPALLEVPSIRAAFDGARYKLLEARTHCYRLLDRMWEEICAGRQIDDAGMESLRSAALELVDAARRGVDDLYPYCGLHAASDASDINRVWRDLHTATQHAMLLPE